MMFPFLVQNRFPDSKETQETTHLGPGTYAPEEMQKSTKDLKMK